MDPAYVTADRHVGQIQKKPYEPAMYLLNIRIKHNNDKKDYVKYDEVD